MISILRSIWITFLHAFHKRETRGYPEKKPYLPPRYRGRIVLTRDPDGKERCVACNLVRSCLPGGLHRLAGNRGFGWKTVSGVFQNKFFPVYLLRPL